MCTVSVLPFEDGEFSLLMNRDESLRRPAALDIKLGHSDGGLEFAYPLDPQSAGSWIGVNGRGLVLALMNQHPDGYTPPPGLRSRGQLIPALLSALDSHEAAQRMASLDPSPFAPFFLLALDARGDYHALRWDGRERELLRYSREPRLFASSSYQAEEVLLGRQEQFERLLRLLKDAPDSDAALLLQRRFHASHHPVAGPYSVCVHRGEAGSVSLSEVRVRGLHVRLRYHAGPPCEQAREQEATLG